MGSLLPNLLSLVQGEYNLEVKVKDNVKFLHKELVGMQADLREVMKL